MKIYRATYESRSFSFDAFASTEKSARQVLQDVLRRHGVLMKLGEVDWYEADGVEVREIVLGQGYRDREAFGPITDPHK